LRLAKEIRTEVHKSQQIRDGKVRLVKHIDNQKVLADFVAERIEDRKIVNPKGHEQDFTRAVLVIDRENLSLKTATRKELQKAVNKIDRNNIHRRVCSRLNSLLSFIGRRERLEAAEYNEVPTIFTESEFINLVENLEVPAEFSEFKEEIKNLFCTLFYTGLRIGEAFALSEKRQKAIAVAKNVFPIPAAPINITFLGTDFIKLNCMSSLMIGFFRLRLALKSNDSKLACVLKCRV
jgi:integrase